MSKGSKEDKIKAIRKIGLLSDTLKQLLYNECIEIKGNPISIVPTSLIEICYSLNWRVKSFENSLTDSEMTTFPNDRAEILMKFNNPVTRDPVEIQSTWIYIPRNAYKVEYDSKGGKAEETLSFKNQKERIEMSGQFLKKWIQETIK